MQNSIVVLIFSVLDGKHLFWANYLILSKARKMTHNLDLHKFSKMTHNFGLPKIRKMSSLRKAALRSNHSAVSKANNYKQNFFAHSIKNAKLVIRRFKPIIRRIKRNRKTTCKKTRDIKGYESISEDELIRILVASK